MMDRQFSWLSIVWRFLENLENRKKSIFARSFSKTDNLICLLRWLQPSQHNKRADTIAESKKKILFGCHVSVARQKKQPKNYWIFGVQCSSWSPKLGGFSGRGVDDFVVLICVHQCCLAPPLQDQSGRNPMDRATKCKIQQPFKTFERRICQQKQSQRKSKNQQTTLFGLAPAAAVLAPWGPQQDWMETIWIWTLRSNPGPQYLALCCVCQHDSGLVKHLALVSADIQVSLGTRHWSMCGSNFSDATILIIFSQLIIKPTHWIKPTWVARINHRNTRKRLTTYLACSFVVHFAETRGIHFLGKIRTFRYKNTNRWTSK